MLVISEPDPEPEVVVILLPEEGEEHLLLVVARVLHQAPKLLLAVGLGGTLNGNLNRIVS